jgi:hypothetical protein
MRITRACASLTVLLLVAAGLAGSAAAAELWSGAIRYSSSGSQQLNGGTVRVVQGGAVYTVVNSIVRNASASYTVTDTTPCEGQPLFGITFQKRTFVGGGSLGAPLGLSIASDGSYGISVPNVPGVMQTQETEFCNGNKTTLTLGPMVLAHSFVTHPAGSYSGSGPLAGSAPCLHPTACANLASNTPAGVSGSATWFLSPCGQNLDSDSDGLVDCREIELGTKPQDADSDDDGISDGSEVAQGTDPNDPSDPSPQPPPPPPCDISDPECQPECPPNDPFDPFCSQPPPCDPVDPTCTPLPPPDADFDEVPDDEDNCRNDWNPDQTDTDGDGSGDACDPPVDCDAKFTTATSKAELPVPLFADPDLFEFRADVKWCLSPSEVILQGTDSDAFVTLDPLIATVFEELAHEAESFTYAIDVVTGMSATTVEIPAEFSACFSALTALSQLSFGIGDITAKLGKRLAHAYQDAVKRGLGTASIRQALAAEIVHAFQKYADEVAKKAPKRIDKLLAFAPDSVRSLIRSELPQAIVARVVTVVAQSATAAVGRLVDDLAALGSGATNAVVDDLVGAWVEDKIEDAISLLRPCYPLWQPTYSVTLNVNGTFDVTRTDLYANPFLRIAATSVTHQE